MLRPAEGSGATDKSSSLKQILFSDITGEKLAFIQGGSLKTVSRDGKGFQRIHALENNGIGARIAWSPRGDRIGFSIEGKIFSIAVDGASLETIADGEIAAWSLRR